MTTIGELSLGRPKGDRLVQVKVPIFLQLRRDFQLQNEKKAKPKGSELPSAVAISTNV